MFRSSKQIMIIAFVGCLLLSATKVFACRCVPSPTEIPISDAVKSAIENSTMVFTGKVVGFEYRKGVPNRFIELEEKNSGKRIDYETKVVKFQVERWWKGEAPTEIFLVTAETKNSDGTGSFSSCDYYFKANETYLVYAFGKENELRTHSCARTRLLNETEDLKILGEGKESVEKKDEPNKISGVNDRRLFSDGAASFLLFVARPVSQYFKSASAFD